MREIKKIAELKSNEVALLTDTDNISFKNRAIIRKEDGLFLISNGKDCPIDKWPNVGHYVVESIGFLHHE